MKKFSIFYICASVIVLPKLIFAEGVDPEKKSRVLPLKGLVTKQQFDFKNDLNKRQKLKELLEKHDVAMTDAFDFEGQVTGDIDLSEFDLWSLNFSGGIFNHTNLSKTKLDKARFQRAILNNVNLKGADLREPFSDPNYFEGCIFNNVKLKGALLYGETKEEFLYLKGTSEPFNLVRQYSDLMKKARVKREENSIQEAEILEKQAQAIHKLFTTIPLDLEDRDLRGFDLTGLDFKNANLKNASLQGTRLSRNVVVPDYNSNRTLLFDQWISEDEEKQKIFQDLLNAGVNLFRGVDNPRLREVNWGGKNLKNATFINADLRDCDFTGVNLKETYLYGAKLQGLRLSENVIVPNYEVYNPTPLFDEWMSQDKEKQILFQALLNAGVNLFLGVDQARLQEVPWGSKNLKNANFNEADLRGCNFTGVNLKETYLYGAYIIGLRLSENVIVPHYEDEDRTPLFDEWMSQDKEKQRLFQGLLEAGVDLFEGVNHAQLKNVNWTYKNLKNANFYRIDLRGFNFSGANLYHVNLYGCKLEGANFKRANLREANIRSVELSNKVKFNFDYIPKQLQDIYQTNSDPKVKKLAKQLLKGIGYFYPIE